MSQPFLIYDCCCEACGITDFVPAGAGVGTCICIEYKNSCKIGSDLACNAASRCLCIDQRCALPEIEWQPLGCGVFNIKLFGNMPTGSDTPANKLLE